MLGQLNVLLVEDNLDHTVMIRRHLEKSKFQPCHLTTCRYLKDGLSLLQSAKQTGIDVVLLDLSLPDSDLTETLTRTLEVASRTPVVVLSSLEDRDFAAKMVHTGAQDYLCKSDLNAELLIRTIRYAIERKEVQIQLNTQVNFANALAELSQIAVKSHNLQADWLAVLEVLRRTLNLDYVEYLERKDSEYVLLASNGKPHNWQGRVVAMGLEGQTGYPFLESGDGIRAGVCTRFAAGASRCVALHHRELGIVTGICAALSGDGGNQAYGTLGLFSTVPRIFGRDEVKFVESVVTTLATSLLRSRLEVDLEEKICALDEAHRRKDEFLATLSHELKTPLNAIIGYAEILKKLSFSEPDCARAVDVIIKNANAEARLISETLDISRIVTGKFKMAFEDFDFDELISLANESFQLAAAEKGVNLTVVSPQRGLGCYRGDRERIRQVLWNLLSNSIKFTPKGGQVVLGCERSSAGLEIFVSDTGQGIEKESLGRVFDTFWQEDRTPSRTFLGMGLGLSIAKAIVTMHGGTIGVRSPGRGKGSCFTVRLPTSGPERATNGASGAGTVAFPPTPNALEGLSFLVIEDDESSGTFLRTLLESFGAKQVTWISDPAAGLDFAKRGGVDMVISDIGLPGMDGYEVMARLRQREKDEGIAPVPALALTAYGGQLHADRALEAGFNGYHEKPLRADVLVSSLLRILHATNRSKGPVM